MYSKLKTLAGDTLFYGTFNIVGRFLSFLLTPIYTNFLVPEEFGFVLYVFSIIAFVNVICTLSLDTAFFRFYDKTDPDTSKKVFSMPFWIIFGVSFTINLLIIGLSHYYSNSNPKLSEMFFWASFLPLLDSIIMLPYCQMRIERRLKRFSFTRVFVISISVILTIVFLKYTNMGGKGVFIAHSIGAFTGLLLFLPIIIKNITFKFNFEMLKELLVFSLPNLPASFSVILLQFGDQFMLKNMVSSSDLAMYGANYKLALPMMMFVTMFDYAWKPYYLSHFKEANAKQFFITVFTYFVLVCSFVFLIFSMLMKYIVAMPFLGGRFYNPHYWTGMHIIPFVLLGYFFNGIYNNLGLGINITKKTKYFPISVGFAALINVVSNYFLIPIYGFQAAAWSTAWSYFAGAALLYYFVRKVYPLNYQFSRIFKIIGISIGLFIISLFAKYSKYSLIIEISLILVYPVLLYIFGFFQDSEIRKFKSFFSRKMNKI